MGFKNKVKEIDDKVDNAVAKGKKKGKSLLRKMLLFSFLGLLLAGIAYVVYAGYVYSEGSRSGELIKISKKGFPFKTYEGQLKLGGIDMQNAQNGTISDTWEFSVRDQDIVEELEKLQGQEVMLEYEQIMQPLPWQGDTRYFIIDVTKK